MGSEIPERVDAEMAPSRIKIDISHGRDILKNPGAKEDEAKPTSWSPMEKWRRKIIGKRPRELMSRDVTDMGTGAKLNGKPKTVTAVDSMQSVPAMTMGPSAN